MKKLIFPLLLIGSAFHTGLDAKSLNKKSSEFRTWMKKPVPKKTSCIDFSGSFIACIADGF